MVVPKPLKPDPFWRDIPGYGGKYQVSRIGEVRRVLKDGSIKIKIPYKKKTQRDRRYYVKLSHKSVAKEITVMAAVCLAFKGAPPAGKVMYHKNGDITDDRLDNIGFISRADLGRIAGTKSGKKKAVVMFNERGEDIEIYPSAREAARENFLSSQTVLDRCHGRIKKPFNLNGYSFRFDT